MQELKRRLTALRRKKQHVKTLENRITELHNEILKSTFKSEYSSNKNITIINGNIKIKVELLKKYNRRLKLITFFR